MARVDHAAMEVRRDMAAVLLEAQKLYAPFDGVISAPNYRENANVSIEDSREIATIVQLDPIHVRAPASLDRVLYRVLSGTADPEDIADITVKLELPNGDAYSHDGRIVSSTFGLDPESQEATLIIEFPNPDHILRPGMKVKATGYED